MASTFRAAFYKSIRPGIPGIYNRLVRARGRGRYSHVELQFSERYNHVSASSSFEDKGTRFKFIEFSDTNWDFIDLPIEWEAFAHRWFLTAAKANKGYDIRGNLHIAIGFLPDSSSRFFCSEAIGYALQFEEAFRLEPNAFYSVLKRAVAAYWQAKQQFPEAA